jgi:CHAD domain-containing protein
VAHTRTELKWLGAVLGAVRDADVRREHLTQPAPAPSPAETAGLAELCRRQDEQRRRASRQLSDALRSDRYLDLLDRLHAGARTPPCVEGAGPGAGRGPDDGAAHVLPTLVGRPWRKLRRKVRRAGRHPSDRALHRIRIAAKQLRYAAEMAAPVMGKPARRTARAAARLQTVLGDHHDAVTAEEWLRRASLHVAPAASFVAGRLAAEETSRQRQRRAQWRAVWNGLDRKMRRKWLE